MKRMLAVLAVVLAGCQSPAKWQGTVEPNFELSLQKGVFGSGAKFKSTKDDTYQIDSLTYNPTTKEFTLTGFKVRQDVPSVMSANIQQMTALIPLRQLEIDYQAQLGRNIENAMKAGGDAVQKVLSTVAPSPFHVLEVLGGKAIDAAASTAKPNSGAKPPADPASSESLTGIEAK